MKHKAVYLLFCKFTLNVSSVNHTHHQEYSKLPTATGSVHIFCAATSLQRGQASLATYETYFRINYVNVSLNTIGNGRKAL